MIIPWLGCVGLDDFGGSINFANYFLEYNLGIARI